MMYKLKLYVMGTSPKSKNLVRHIEDFLEKRLSDQAQLEVIDVFQNPETAEADGVFATPTIVKICPSPVKKIVGNLTDMEKVFIVMEIK